MNRLSKLLELYWDNGLDITASPKDDLMEVLGRDRLDARARLVYLLNFAAAEQPEEEKQAAILGLEACVDPPVRLDDWQKELLKKPFTATRSLFQAAEFEEVCALLRSCQGLMDIIRLLHEKAITESLSLDDYRSFAGDASECCALLSAVSDRLGPEDTAEFIFFWEKNNYALDELRRLERRIAAYPAQDWDSVFSTYSGYVNLLYGTRFKTIDLSDVRNYFDAEWHALSEEMGLSEEFLTLHRDAIIAFLCENGAYITRTYQECLDGTQRESFYRVVKAELMGQLRALKYFEGDLQRELDAPLTERVKEGWSKNISIAKSDMEVRECDDFFSTMLLGVQPQETCMSYVDGAYRSCLLSSFDSNKKVLYVFLHGRVVGRAFLRLTKGRLTGTARETRRDSFTFVDLEDVAASRQNERSAQEKLTLFLESPYISGVHPEQDDQVRKLLIELACEKADELGTMLVLSMDYFPSDQTFTRTLFEIYISKSKAGAQYLDSLDGQATVSEERSYKASSFLVREYIPLCTK